ncbi:MULTISPECIES: glycosyltransferase family 9 protein [unclassified Algibacter]|uniref:glycosyltransferase family 9 protein n=1 Tax=unclassified Algibacter TaxID=2615009 RepID=UPI00131E9FF1|nr:MULTISPECIES: glycosyltransferase family 9 protein [unclassified Algibacter]MCL5128024.1 glycosyltransferase family 9 protein [Algibacter sp. L4_22]
MTFKKRVNNIRRNIMRGITKNVGSSYNEPEKGSIKIEDVKRVLIIRPNHRLGNQLLLTPLVQEVINTFPNCEIDLFVKGGVAYPVFENYNEVSKIIQLPRKPFSNIYKYAKSWISVKSKSYDMVINGDKNSSSGRLLTNLAKAKVKIFGDVNESIQNEYSDHRHISKYPIYNLRYDLERLGFKKNMSPLPVLDIKLDVSEIAKGKAILDDIIKNDKKTICIYTNATGNKCYSETWWETFYERLKAEYPDFNIIEMLPIENISKINFKSPNFYSKDIREMAGIIKNTSIFIAADNGVMHLASASLTPCVGFFSVTNENIYAPYGNGSVALNTNHTDIEDWIKSIDGILR